MEVSNSELLFSQEKDLNIMEFDFLVTQVLHDRVQREEDGISSWQDSNNDECKSSKGFNNPIRQEAQESSQEFKNVHVEEAKEEVDDGFKTPVSSGNKIAVVLKCPPAPKKPKSVPLSKRKCPALRRVLLDLSNEIESLFPPDVLKDLISGKIKKVKKDFNRIL